MNGGASICFIRLFRREPLLTKLNKKYLGAGETFWPPIHLSYQYHFEDTPREAVKAQTPWLLLSFYGTFFVDVAATSRSKSFISEIFF